MLICYKLHLQVNQVCTSVSFCYMYNRRNCYHDQPKINNKKWREELTALSDLDTQLFVGIIIRSRCHWCCYNLEKVLTT